MKNIKYYIIIVVLISTCSIDLFSQKLCDFNCDVNALYLKVIRDEFGDTIFNNLLRSNYRAHAQFRYIGKYDLYEINIKGESQDFLMSNINYFNRFKEALRRQPYLPAGSLTNNDLGSFVFNINFSKITTSWDKNKQKSLLDYAKIFLDSVACENDKRFNRKFNIESTATNKCERFPVDSLRYTNNKELFEYYILNILLNIDEDYINKLVENQWLGYLQMLTFLKASISSSAFNLDLPYQVLDALSMNEIISNIDNQPYKYIYIEKRDRLGISYFYEHKIDCSSLVKKFHESESHRNMSLVEFAKEYIPKRYAELELEWECNAKKLQIQNDSVAGVAGRLSALISVRLIP